MGNSKDRCSNFQPKKCSRKKRHFEDRLSSLPNDILLFILSSLTFKEVVKTSLLSHRWLNLWMHTLVLHLDVPYPKALHMDDIECQNYVNSVNCVLGRHKGQYLKEFKTVCYLDKRYQKDIDNWLLIALSKKIQCLELNFLYSGRHSSNLNDNYVFPSQIFNFCSGQANLNGCKSQFLQFEFKYLKSLSLKRVDVTGETINFFLRSCPFLERLEVVGNLTLVSLIISDPKLVLKYLVLKNCLRLKILNISNFNLVSLDVSSVGDLTLTNLPMLVELFISGARNTFSQFIAQASSSCFSQLKALTYTGNKLQDLAQLSNYNRLTKLKRLVIKFGACNDESLTKIISIINSCPLLEEFVLAMSWYSPKRTRRPIFKVEGCSSSSLNNKSLKVFEFDGYYGRFCDVELIMHVVANCVGLEKIILDPRNILLIGCVTVTGDEEEEVRSHALEQFDSLREAIPPHVNLLIR